MKIVPLKIGLVLVIILIAKTTGQAQTQLRGYKSSRNTNKVKTQIEDFGNSAYRKGSHLFSIGYGTSSIRKSYYKQSSIFSAFHSLTVNGVGPFHIKYGYCFQDGWSIGLNTNILM